MRRSTASLLLVLGALRVAPASSAAETFRVSPDSGEIEANAYSADPVLSATGRYVAFSSEASNLVPEDGNDRSDVFVHDRKTGETASPILLSAGLEGSSQPVLSANGHTLAFQSDGPELVAGDENGAQDIFVHDRR